jgi:hypothetical protein
LSRVSARGSLVVVALACLDLGGVRDGPVVEVGEGLAQGLTEGGSEYSTPTGEVGSTRRLFVSTALPSGRSITLAGFTSRCRTPTAWAARSAANT